MRAPERVFRLLDHLSSRRWGVGYRELAAEFDVTERTIRRDLEVLRDAGFELEATTTDEGTRVFVLRSLPPALERFAQRTRRGSSEGPIADPDEPLSSSRPQVGPTWAHRFVSAAPQP